jgi:hypothetical protein
VKIFWAWQSDHPREISRDVIRTALEAAIDHIKEERDVIEPPDESRGDLHIDHDTKGLTGSPDVASAILEKIAASKVFVGDLTPVGSTPAKTGNEGHLPGRPLMNPNVAIEYGYALKTLSDSGVIGVLNLAFGNPEGLPFDIIHKRWPIRYRLVEGATKAEIDRERNVLKGQFVTALKGFLNNPQPEAVSFEETPTHDKAFYFNNDEQLGHCNQLGGQVSMTFRQVLYVRLIPTKPLLRPIAERTMVSKAYQYGAMGSQELTIPITNQYGAMCFAPMGNTRNVDAMTQYFPNGEVWAINADIMRHGRRTDDFWYLLNQAEDAFMKTLKRGLDYMKDVAGVELPIKVIAGVVGLKGRRIVVSGTALGVHGRMMTDEVHLPMIFHDDSIEAQDKFLLALFNKIFDQSGAPRAPGINGFPKMPR